jgi:FtsP/CotA-like multicopper oxidase with cupredoxin domain
MQTLGKNFANSRRRFPKATGLTAGALLLSPRGIRARVGTPIQHSEPAVPPSDFAPADYTLRIAASPKENQQVAVGVYNGTDTLEPLHWHGRKIPTDVDGASEEGFNRWTINGTPFPATFHLRLGAHQEAEIDSVADNPGLALFHCHRQLHRDYGFTTLFDYV